MPLFEQDLLEENLEPLRLLRPSYNTECKKGILGTLIDMKT